MPDSRIHYTRPLTRILVQTPSRSYEALVESGLLRSAATALRDVVPPESRVFAVTSPKIRKLWGGVLQKSYSEAGRKTEFLEMPDGERSKKLSQLEKLAAKLVRRGADRHSVILALGGGVVGDVGGFLASVFMRGVPVVQVPTTLLAQVDAAIGGKSGVNLAAGKNLIGTFHQPLAVLVDPDLLATLPEREYRSGLFEAMKYGVIRNPAIFELMESERDALLHRDGALLEKLPAKLFFRVVAPAPVTGEKLLLAGRRGRAFVVAVQEDDSAQWVGQSEVVGPGVHQAGAARAPWNWMWFSTRGTMSNKLLGSVPASRGLRLPKRAISSLKAS